MHEVVRKHCMDYLVSHPAASDTPRPPSGPKTAQNAALVLQMKNADYFSNYVTEDFTTYINRKRKNNCHGNHIEMQAMAEMYNRPVEVYQYGNGEPFCRTSGGEPVPGLTYLTWLPSLPATEPINTFHGIHQNNDEPIRVSYHRNIHYNSVVNPNKATIGVGLGLPAFKPGVPFTENIPIRVRSKCSFWLFCQESAAFRPSFRE